VPGISDWIEQLIAESTGKNEKGVLPIVISSPTSAIGGSHPVITFNGDGPLSVTGTLGSQFIFWEWVTALLCVALKVDPFNQPNVTEAKNQTGALLTRWIDGRVQSPAPAFVIDSIEIYSDKKFDSVAQYLTEAISGAGYIAIMAYLNRVSDHEISEIRELIAAKSEKPTTFGWGPRFLHSTGQFHKGGPQVGSFIQVTGNCARDIAIPNQGYGFETLIMAQALGDGEALQKRKFPLLRIHLRDRMNGISQLLAIIKSI
jgi:glucose-6-phosphate isomerase